MQDLKKKFENLDIPLFIKKAIVEVYTFERKEDDAFSKIKMELLAGSRL